MLQLNFLSIPLRPRRRSFLGASLYEATNCFNEIFLVWLNLIGAGRTPSARNLRSAFGHQSILGRIKLAFLTSDKVLQSTDFPFCQTARIGAENENHGF
jgi:hypothetical protein